MARKLVEIKGITKEFPTGGGAFSKKGSAVVHAVTDVSLDVYEGETLGLVGESGCGKSTLGRLILNLIPPTRGHVIFDGTDLQELSVEEMRKMRTRMQMVFQDPYASLNPRLSIHDIVAEPMTTHNYGTKEEITARVEELLRKTGIRPEFMYRYPHQFSGGQKQRVVIAMSLLCNPKLLIADEPTTALDVTIQAQVLDIINQLREQYKMAMVLITHDLGVVAETCDNVAIMYAGQIVEAGTVREVYLNPKHPYTRGLFDSIPKLDDDSTELIPIEGAISNAPDLPTGCFFHPRCRYCQDICKTQQPTVKGEGHKFMCHFDLFSKEEEK